MQTLNPGKLYSFLKANHSTCPEKAQTYFKPHIPYRFSCTGSPVFFCGSVLGQDTSEPQPLTGENKERHE